MAELTYARDLYYRDSRRTPAWRVAAAALAVVTPAAAVIGALYAFLIANVAIVGHITVLVAAAVLLLAGFAAGLGALNATLLRRAGVRSIVVWWIVAG